MSINMDRVGLLLHVITKAAEHGPNFRDIMSEANIELTAMNEIAREDGIKRTAAKAAAEAIAKAEAEAPPAHVAALTAVEPTPHGDQSPKDHTPTPGLDPVYPPPADASAADRRV